MIEKKRTRLHFKNCIVWTGEIGSAAPREVLVADRHIAACKRQIDPTACRDAAIIDWDDDPTVSGARLARVAERP